MFGIGTQEIIIICVVALVVLGPKKVPQLAQMVGKGLKEFRKALNSMDDDDDDDPVKEDDTDEESDAIGIASDVKMESDSEKVDTEDSEGTRQGYEG